MMQKVQKCLETHVGGEVYFNELDAAIKSDDGLLKSFITKVRTLATLVVRWIAVRTENINMGWWIMEATHIL